MSVIKILAPIAFAAMIGMYGYWFYKDFLKPRIAKRKQDKLEKESVPAEVENENTEA